MQPTTTRRLASQPRATPVGVRPNVKRRRFGLHSLAVSCLAFGLAGTPAASNEVVNGQAVSDVVELFTSQGCSSCPTADRLLADFSRREHVLALAYHVDYWDYIGWPDPLASRENTERQQSYGKARGTNMVYTPQIVVNGVADLVGSDARGIEAALRDTDTRTRDGSEVRLTLDGSTIHVFADVDPAAAETGDETVLVLVAYRGEMHTKVTRGENSGHDLVNMNSVRSWRVVGKIAGRPIEVDMPLASLADPDGGETGYAAFLQRTDEDGRPGMILAAAKLPIQP